MADLGNLDYAPVAEEGAVLTLLHPQTGEVLKDNTEKEMQITLIGADAPSYQAVINGIANRKVDKAQRTKVFKTTAEEAENEQIEVLARATKGWQNIYVEGAHLDFSLENARKLYKRFKWMREQAQSFIDDRANFIKA